MTVPISVHPAALDLESLRLDCDVATTRRSGPGGQHRNKVETAVVITHRPTKVRGQASERRSQALNADSAWQRLRVQLALEVRLPRELQAPPSALWAQRAAKGISHVNSEHPDFPALLAEALDALTAHEHRVPETAGSLGATTSQLVKFFHVEPAAWEQINRQRRACGLKPLK